MIIKDLFWRKNIFGQLRRSFLGINSDSTTWKGLKKDHALEWGDANENPGYWSILFNKIYNLEENKNEIHLLNSSNHLKIWSTKNIKRGDRPKISQRIWDPKISEDLIESWYLKNFILSKKIISQYISRKNIKSGDEYKFYNIVSERLNELNKIKNITYLDINLWAEVNKNIFNKLTFKTEWFEAKNLKIEIEKNIIDQSYIILFNTHENIKSFYTTIINKGEFLQPSFFDHVNKNSDSGGYFKDAKSKNDKIDYSFLYTVKKKLSDKDEDDEVREKLFDSHLNQKIREAMSDIAIESSYQQDINNIDSSQKIKEGPLEVKNRKGSSLSDLYIPRRDRSISAYALKKANYLCQINENHKTFIQNNERNYVEGHHVIPMSAQDQFEYSIDVPENIVALCPNCHRKVHLSNMDTRLIMINELLKIINVKKLSDRKIDITLDKLKKYYQL